MSDCIFALYFIGGPVEMELIIQTLGPKIPFMILEDKVTGFSFYLSFYRYSNLLFELTFQSDGAGVQCQISTAILFSIFK